jgi:hypothetical protein
MFMTLVFGVIGCFLWKTSKDVREIASVPPHEMTLAELIDKGPGPNRHVVVTDYEPGGYAYETKDKGWTQVWIAMFPRQAPRTEIRAVFSSRTILNENQLRQILGAGRWKGICSTEPRTSWGTVLYDNLVNSNKKMPLKAAWEVEDLREPPSETEVFLSWLLGVGCMSATILLAGLIFLFR